MEPTETSKALGELNRKWHACTGCPRYDRRKAFLTGRGATSNTKILVVVASHTSWDIADREVASGPHGMFLAGALKLPSLGTSELVKAGVYITPSCACVSVDSRRYNEVSQPNDSMARACAGRVREEIQLLEPEVIITLGSIATNVLVSEARTDILKTDGGLTEAVTMGDLIQYSVPTLTLPSINGLLRDPDPAPNGSWQRFFTAVGRLLEVMNDGNAGTDTDA